MAATAIAATAIAAAAVAVAAAVVSPTAMNARIQARCAQQVSSQVGKHKIIALYHNSTT